MLLRALLGAAAFLPVQVNGLGFQDRGLTSGVIVQQRRTPNFEPLPPGPGILSGRIIDRETAAPLPGARVIVRLLGEATAQFTYPSTPFGRVLTAEPDGLFTVSQVTFGDYVVDVEVPGYTGDDSIFRNVSRRQMRVSAGRPLSTETFRLSARSQTASSRWDRRFRTPTG